MFIALFGDIMDVVTSRARISKLVKAESCHRLLERKKPPYTEYK
jgi:hypothetical protein